jgi:hypothetical protein
MEDTRSLAGSIRPRWKADSEEDNFRKNFAEGSKPGATEVPRVEKTAVSASKAAAGARDYVTIPPHTGVAELADARDLKCKRGVLPKQVVTR